MKEKPSGKPGGFLFLALILLSGSPKGDRMKTKVVIFVLCNLLAACGMGKRDGEKVKENVTGIVQLTNHKASQYQKIQSFQSDNQYLVLGTVDMASVPEVIRSLPSESEIGTLTVEFEDEIYASKYEGEVRPVFKKRQQEIKTTVLMVKEKTNPSQLYFVVKNNESANELRVREVPLTVYSSPREYCYRSRFFIKQLVDKIAVLDQVAICNPAGICNILFRYDWPSSHDVPGTYNLNARPVQVANQCLETQIYHEVEETKVNRSMPRVATIKVSEEISKTELKLTFDL